MNLKGIYKLFPKKISRGLARPKNKFITQMVYGILAGHKVHLSEIAHSLNETIRLKKTIWHLSRNLFAFGKEILSSFHPHLYSGEIIRLSWLHYTKKHPVLKDNYLLVYGMATTYMYLSESAIFS